MADVKILRPQRLTDNPDGGGVITSVEIVSGEINNLFDDVSNIDRVNGDLSMRAFGVVANTANLEVYNGLHLIVRSPPQDPRVSLLLFSADNAGGWAGTRDDARAFVERYLDPSIATQMIPFDTQLAGSRAVLVYQRPSDPMPVMGEVYCLENETGTVRDFVRVQDVDHFDQQRFDGQHEYTLRVINIQISYPLANQYTGSEPDRRVIRSTGGARLRGTLVADSARYKGIVKLSADAAVNDSIIRLGSVFGRLVPSALSESSISNVDPPGASVIIGARDTTYTQPVTPFSGSIDPQQTRFLRRAFKPKSMVIQHPGNSWDRVDDGKGNIINRLDNNAIIGSVDYAAGSLTMFNTPAVNWLVGTMTATYVPAAVVRRSAFTAHQPITIGTRGYVYNFTLIPLPAAGTTVVSFRALGRWYDLTDDGTGKLVGDGGTGQVNLTTGFVSVTLAALPDVGSSVTVAWGGASETEVLTSEFTAVVPELSFQLTHNNAEPNSVSVTWLAGGVTRTATDNGSGVLTGDATGKVLYGTGLVGLRPTLLPDSNSEFTVDYDSGGTLTELFNPNKSGSTITMTAAQAPIRPRSLLITYQQTALAPLFNYTTTQQLTDNGAGELVDADGNVKAGSVVNYTTGQISFNPDFTAVTPVLNYQRFQQNLPARIEDPSTGKWATIAAFGQWPIAAGNEPRFYGYVDGTNVTVQYKRSVAVDTARQDVFPPQPLPVDFIPRRANALVPGGLMFNLGTRVYVDRGGQLYHSVSDTTGAAAAAGTVIYANGKASLTSWEGGIAPVFSVQALLTDVRPMPVNMVYGRTPGSPLRPASFRIEANRYSTGALITAQADQDGNLDTANIRGTIDATTGVYTAAFGAWVQDSTLTPQEKAEPWYNAANVQGDGFIWRPFEATPGSIRISGVVQTSLPIDPAILNVNPVRLPPDGRVQIIRPGDTLVIHNTRTQALATPVAGATVTMPRGALASLRVFDNNNLAIVAGTSTYSVNLVSGSLTWANPLDLGASVAPYTAVHAIEDMALCIDAQITGEVTLSTPLTHAYDDADSYCSSALVLGDAVARYGNLFAQNTWTSVWSDTLIGSPPTSGAQYNDVAFPLVLLNRDCITERWRLQFTSSTAFNIIGETMGVIGTGNTSTLVAPINPITSQPFWQMLPAGFGIGYATGNVIRFNTYAAGGKVWAARPVQSGPATFSDDRAQVEPRWSQD